MIGRCCKELNKHSFFGKIQKHFFQLAEVFSRSQIDDEATWYIKGEP